MMSVALFGLTTFGTAAGASAAGQVSVVASCTGNTLKGTVSVSRLAAGSTVLVRAEAQTSGWAIVGAPAVVTVVAGQSSYLVSINVAGLPGVKAFRLVATAASGPSGTSNHVKVGSCGPPAQVPEVPAPLVIPATMLLTAGVVEVLRRQRLSRLAA